MGITLIAIGTERPRGNLPPGDEQSTVGRIAGEPWYLQEKPFRRGVLSGRGAGIAGAAAYVSSGSAPAAWSTTA